MLQMLQAKAMKLWRAFWTARRLGKQKLPITLDHRGFHYNALLDPGYFEYGNARYEIDKHRWIAWFLNLFL